MAFVYLAFFDDSTSFPYLPVLLRDFRFGADTLSSLIKEYAAGSNLYIRFKEKGRTYYEVYSLQGTEKVPEDYKEISFVCLRADGAYEAPNTVGIMCGAAKKKVKGLEDFHFHTLRHTYTSNLLSGGAKPKDVQELLGHSDVSTTMNIYAHSTREAKRTSARLLDKVVGGE